MAFHESEFPRKISIYQSGGTGNSGAVGGPKFSTTVNTGYAGFEQRNRNWVQQRHKYQVDLNNKVAVDWQPVLALFYICGGQADAFRFFDHKDNQAIGSLIGTGDGVTQSFQLQKVYTFGSQTFERLISKPITSSVLDFQGNPLTDTVTVYVSALAQTRPSQYFLDYTTGVVVFNNGNNSVVITAATRSGSNTIYTYTVASGHGLAVGQSITITGMADAGNNTTAIISTLGTGTFTIPNGSGVTTSSLQSGIGITGGVSFVAISAATYSGGNTTYTYTLLSGAALVSGMRVVIASMTDAGNNGTFYIASLGSGTFTVVNANGVTHSSQSGNGTTDWTPAKGAIITADFQFHVPVRFGSDDVAALAEVPPDVPNGIQISWPTIMLVEVKIAAGQSQG